MRAVVWLVLLTGLLAGCRDHDAEALARAQLAHRALLAQSARPDDARFEPVLVDLDSIRSNSKHFAEAQRLAGVIRNGRVKVRTPLALGDNGRRPPELEAQLAACRRLAQFAGLDGGVDRRALEALEACRKQAEQLELRFAHGDEDAHP